MLRRIGWISIGLGSASASVPSMSRVRTALVPKLRSTAANSRAGSSGAADRCRGRRAPRGPCRRDGPGAMRPCRSWYGPRRSSLLAASWPCESLLFQVSGGTVRMRSSWNRFPSITGHPRATLAVIVSQVSAAAAQSGNLVSVSCSDSSHSAPAVASRCGERAARDRPVRPRIANFGPMKLLPGRSCDAANSVCRAPKSASVPRRLRGHQNFADCCRSGPAGWSPSSRDARSARTAEPAASSLRCNSLVNSRFASLAWP